MRACLWSRVRGHKRRFRYRVFGSFPGPGRITVGFGCLKHQGHIWWSTETRTEGCMNRRAVKHHHTMDGEAANKKYSRLGISGDGIIGTQRSCSSLVGTRNSSPCASHVRKKLACSCDWAADSRSVERVREVSKRISYSTSTSSLL